MIDPSQGLLVYTDGSCSTKSRVGGWAYVAIDQHSKTHQDSGYVHGTTISRMELEAPYQALMGIFKEHLGCELEIVTDSEYVRKGYTMWLPKWKESAERWSQVKNPDQWTKLEDAVNLHQHVQWRHIPGHSGNKWNDLVDGLAVAARYQGEKVLYDELCPPTLP